jgi:holo-[acyl-carrier protein] synthase
MFLSSEIEYCLRFKNKYEHFAGKFAIKEAVKKAIDESISLLDIETMHNKSKPQVKLRGKLKNKYLFLASLSHDKNIAIAIVISEVLS